jgi:tetratricopeptide (TPR) repeat protein/predicted Ser/Thr protein kinase
MEEHHPRRPNDRPKAEGTAALKFASDSGSSAAPDTSLGSAPTLVGGSLDTPTLVEGSLDTPTLAEGSSAAGGRPGYSSELNREPVLRPGAVLGHRYEILQLLGEGGMGSVYRARDREVNRIVALKVIRPELTGNVSILDRFKQELVLSHQVTHKNVIRIYDLGAADGVKFITMEFVEGQDLRTLLHEKTKFSPEEAVEITQQICRALEATHSVGVIHRDLKPQNIMCEKSGRILVMDFGLARTVEGDGMTQTGALVGTMEYMSPEQALGKNLDQRSDLFTLGLIFYELLTGKMPFTAGSALASLIKRTQERAAPVSDLDGSIPGALSAIVSKCLERDPALRYQSIKDVLNDLEGWQGKTAAASLAFQSVRRWAPSAWPWIGLMAAVLVLAVVGIRYRDTIFKQTSSEKVPVKPEVSLAILPFRNASGDASLDWLGPSLADMLSTDVGQSARLRAISPDRLHQVLADLRITPGAAVDPTMVGRIAQFTNADTVVWGQYARFGDQIRVDTTLQDLKHDRRVALKIEGVSEKDIPGAVDRLAESIRQNLSVSPDILAELKASSYQPTSKSPEALRAYTQGVQLLREGKYLAALASLQAAAKSDPEFALAYSRLAETDSALGYDKDAERVARKAVDLSQQLPATEKYLIEANHARIAKDSKKAIEMYEKLAQVMPNDLDVQYALGSLYLDQNDYDKARKAYAAVLKLDPKNLSALQYSGWLEVQSGQPEAGLEPLNRGLALAIQVDNQEQRGEILQVLGMAYESLNKSDEAMRDFGQALEIDRKLGKKAGIANTLVEMGNIQSSLGKPDDALRSYTEALGLQREIGAEFGVASALIAIGRVLEDRGQYEKASGDYREALQKLRDLGDQSGQAVCLNNIGNAYLSEGKNDDALTYFQQALQLREKLSVPGDTADTLHNLGEVYAKTAQYDNSMSSYMRALDLRRKAGDAHGAALELHSVGMVFEYQGRYGAAINNLADSVKGFHELKDRSRIMTQVLIDYAQAMVLGGRGAEAGRTLQEAQDLARQLKNDNLIADVLNAAGDAAFYSGDLNAARHSYEEAQRTADRVKGQDRALASRFNLAKIAVAQKQPQALSSLRQIVEQANTLGLKYLLVDSSVYMAEAMINAKDYAAAIRQLQQQLDSSEKLGLRMQSARIHYLLGTSMRLSGNTAEAAGLYRQAASLLDEIKKESGAERLFDRPDLKSIYDESVRLSVPAQA